jgi:hypothetical protein
MPKQPFIYNIYFKINVTEAGVRSTIVELFSFKASIVASGSAQSPTYSTQRAISECYSLRGFKLNTYLHLT